jgi:hypothetical protein
MKKILTITLLLVLVGLAFTSLNVSASPAADPQKTPEVKATEKAAGKPEDKGKPDDKGGKNVNVKGVVASISATSLTITLKDGGTQTFVLDAKTQIKIPGSKKTGTSEIQSGAQVMVQAQRGTGDTLTARHVMLIPGKPQPVHRVGTVSKYQAGVSITIVAQQDGKEYTFKLSTETKILPENRAGELKVGTRVTIISPRDVTGGALAAKGIVVHPADSGPKP